MTDTPEDSIFFNSHPDPMWIYDLESLAFLAVNCAAIERYGYSRDEFLSMTIADIRPQEDVPALYANVRSVTEGQSHAGIWRHCLRSGETIHVEISSRTLVYQGSRAELVSVRDVTAIIELEGEKNLLLEREQLLRQQAEAAAARFRSMFELSPDKTLVLEPEDFRIIAVSDAYLKATLTKREQILDRPMFAVFPDDANDAEATGNRNLRASLDYVKASGKVDVMPLQRYPVPVSEHLDGGFEERFWSVVNTPVSDADGRVTYIIHRAEDVTEVVKRDSGDSGVDNALAGDNNQVVLDILARSRELKAMNDRLREQQSNLNTAQRLADLGIWKLDINSSSLEWSDNLYQMFGVAPSNFAPTLEAYLDLIHPEDRWTYGAKFEPYMANPEGTVTFSHRVIRPDGRVIHVRGIGEMAVNDGQPVLTCVLQDVTAELQASNRLSAAANLERHAGEIARLGGWRVDLRDDSVEWSEQTANIHGLEQIGPRPLSDVLNLYRGEDRARMSAMLAECVERGTPFDEVFHLTTAQGAEVWVRSIGNAEYDHEGAIAAVQGAFQDITSMVEMRERSEKLSRQLRDVLEQTNDAVMMLDSELHITYLNPQAERLAGRTFADLQHRHLSAVLDPEDTAGFVLQYEHAMATGQPVRFTEFLAPMAVWLEVDAYPSREGLVVYFRDVTLQRESIANLRLLESAVAHQSDLLLITEARPGGAPQESLIVYANDALTRTTEFTREEVIGKPPTIFYGPATEREELTRIREALCQRKGVRSELVNYTKTGREICLEVDVIPLLDEVGQVSHYVSVARDNTEKRSIEQNARVNEERFHLVAKATNDVIRDWNLVNDTLWWNEGLENVLGYQRGEVESGGESWINRIHGDDREAVLSSFETLIAGSGNQWQHEYRILHASGTPLIVIDRAFVIRDMSGKALRMVASLEDVTEARRLGDQLRQAQKLEAVGQLTGGVAHDFNNLLTVILGNAELLKEELADQQQLCMLADVTISAAERGAELTRRLLAFSRRQALQPMPLDVNRLVAGMGNLFRRTVSEDVELECVHAEGLWQAEVDQGQLETALLNLVINARDAMSGGGRLTIEATNAALDADYSSEHPEVEPGDYVLLSVSDSGSGMSEEIRQRAFEPFYTTKPVGKGSGLGLSMVYGFIKQSGGHIKVYSEVGEGTTIKLYLPRATTAGETPDSPTTPGIVKGGLNTYWW